MAQYVKQITLDVSGEASHKYIAAKQCDKNSRFLSVLLVGGNQAITIPEGTRAVFRCRKPDGNSVLTDGVISSGRITVELTEQTLAVVGLVKADLALYGSDDSLLTSVTFFIEVNGAAYNEQQVESSYEFNALTAALTEVQNVASTAAEALANSEEALENLDELNAAEAARVTAETGRVTAEGARATAEASRETRFAEMKSNTIFKYGARRLIGQSSATLERLWDAVGKVANAGVGTGTVVNNFDSIYPWSDIRDCNIEIISGKVVVKAYKGEPSFTTDGTNGQVAVEIPKFYVPKSKPGDGYEYWGVSAIQLGGWYLPEAFRSRNGQVLEKIYVAKYNASVIVTNGVSTVVSRAGLPPETARSRTSFRTLAQATDACCHLIGLPYHEVLTTLFAVEFATTHCQGIMSGASSLPYTATHRPVIAESAVNRVILAKANADGYVIGGTIDIGTSQGGRQVAKNRKITAIDVYDASNKAISFDGDAVSTTTEQYVYAFGWYSGATDSVVASSGSPVSNSTGRYPCKYRGIENPWGNVFQWIDGVNIKDYQSYVCSNPGSFQDGLFADPYRKLSYTNGTADGYVKETGFDERYPYARFPVEIGAGSTTYFSDYYYQSTGERAPFFGGSWHYGSSAGLWCFYCYGSWSHVHVAFGARLSWTP